MTELIVAVESIRVDGRHRTDLGDIARLAASIKAEGLINPITVTPDMRLLAGERRLAAVRLLGRDKIEARIVDTLDDAARALRVELDENTERKPMTKSELVALGRALEALKRPEAAERRREGGRKAAAKRLGRPAPKLSSSEESLDTEATVARALGLSQGSYYRAKKVVQAAADTTLTERERTVAAEALADMDSGATSVTASYERIKSWVHTRVGPIPPSTTIESATAQRRAISRAETALSGIRHGLQQITTLHPEISNDEAAHWVDSLLESRRLITSLINILRERTNARQS